MSLEDDAQMMLRSFRNSQLSQSDWTQFADSPLAEQKKAEWAVYRQQLRDLPTNSTPALDENGQLTGVDWPTPPEN